MWTDSLMGEGAVYETAGSLREGKRVWLCAKLPKPINLVGDQTDLYLMFTNSHDASSAVKVAVTPIRVVCQNTLTYALKAPNALGPFVTHQVLKTGLTKQHRHLK